MPGYNTLHVEYDPQLDRTVEWIEGADGSQGPRRVRIPQEELASVELADLNLSKSEAGRSMSPTDRILFHLELMDKERGLREQIRRNDA